MITKLFYFTCHHGIKLINTKQSMGCDAQLASKCLFTPTFFRRAIFTRKVGHTGLVFGVDQSSLVALFTQDYKSLCAAVTICADLRFNIHTYMQNTHTALWPADMKSSFSSDKNNHNYAARRRRLRFCGDSSSCFLFLLSLRADSAE